MSVAHVLDEVLALGSGQQRDRARSLAHQLSEASSVVIVRRPDGSEDAITPEIQRALVALLTAGAEGHRVLVVGQNAEISPQRAAEWLGVSRPFVYRLIERGDLPAHRVGAHYRLQVSDVLALVDRREGLAASVDAGLTAVIDDGLVGPTGADAKASWQAADEDRRTAALERVRGRASRRVQPRQP